jgi:hypothetical protein
MSKECQENLFFQICEKCNKRFIFRGSTMISRSGSNRVLFLTGRDRVEIEDQHNHYLLKESEKYADIIQVTHFMLQIEFNKKK